MTKVIVKVPNTPEEMEQARIAEIEAWAFIYGDAEDAIDNGPIYKNFADGFFTAFVDGRGAGVLKSFRMNLSIHDKIETWDNITDGGTGSKHDPNGDTLYISSLGVSPKFRGLGLGQVLVDHAKELAIKIRCKHVALGCRIPDYHKHTEVPVDKYIHLRRDDGQLLDSELRFYSKCGMTFIKPLPEYMSGEDADPQSLNFGVLSVWRNPFID